MKKVFAFFLALCVLTCSFASVAVEAPPKKASDVYLTVGKNGEQVSLLELSQMKVSELEALTGKDMRLLDKAAFKIAQRDLRKSINEDGTFNSKKMEKLAKRAGEGGGFHLGGFALGFLVGLIGVLIAYLINDDKKSTRVKWAWIGFGIFLVLYLALILA